MTRYLFLFSGSSSCVEHRAFGDFGKKKRKAFRGEGLSGEDVGAIGTCIQPNAPLKASLLMNKDCIRWVFSLRICNIYHGPSAQSLDDFGRRKNVAQALRTDD